MGFLRTSNIDEKLEYFKFWQLLTLIEADRYEDDNEILDEFLEAMDKDSKSSESDTEPVPSEDEESKQISIETLLNSLLCMMSIKGHNKKLTGATAFVTMKANRRNFEIERKNEINSKLKKNVSSLSRERPAVEKLFEPLKITIDGVHNLVAGSKVLSHQSVKDLRRNQVVRRD